VSNIITLALFNKLYDFCSSSKYKVFFRGSTVLRFKRNANANQIGTFYISSYPSSSGGHQAGVGQSISHFAVFDKKDQPIDWVNGQPPMTKEQIAEIIARFKSGSEVFYKKQRISQINSDDDNSDDDRFSCDNQTTYHWANVNYVDFSNPPCITGLQIDNIIKFVSEKYTTWKTTYLGVEVTGAGVNSFQCGGRWIEWTNKQYRDFEWTERPLPQQSTHTPEGLKAAMEGNHLVQYKGRPVASITIPGNGNSFFGYRSEMYTLFFNDVNMKDFTITENKSGHTPASLKKALETHIIKYKDKTVYSIYLDDRQPFFHDTPKHASQHIATFFSDVDINDFTLQEHWSVKLYKQFQAQPTAEQSIITYKGVLVNNISEEDGKPFFVIDGKWTCCTTINEKDVIVTDKNVFTQRQTELKDLILKISKNEITQYKRSRIVGVATLPVQIADLGIYHPWGNYHFDVMKSRYFFKDVDVSDFAKPTSESDTPKHAPQHFAKSIHTPESLKAAIKNKQVVSYQGANNLVASIYTDGAYESHFYITTRSAAIFFNEIDMNDFVITPNMRNEFITSIYAALEKGDTVKYKETALVTGTNIHQHYVTTCKVCVISIGEYIITANKEEAGKWLFYMSFEQQAKSFVDHNIKDFIITPKSVVVPDASKLCTAEQVAVIKWFAAHKQYKVTYTNKLKGVIWSLTNGYKLAESENTTDLANKEEFNWSAAFVDKFDVTTTNGEKLNWENQNLLLYRMTMPQAYKVLAFAANKAYKVTYTVDLGRAISPPKRYQFIEDHHYEISEHGSVDLKTKKPIKTNWDWHASRVTNFTVSKDGVNIPNWLDVNIDNMTNEFMLDIHQKDYVVAVEPHPSPAQITEIIDYVYNKPNWQANYKGYRIKSANNVDDFAFEDKDKRIITLRWLAVKNKDFTVQPSHTMTEEFALRINDTFTKCNMLYKGKRICGVSLLGKASDTVMEKIQINTVGVADFVQVKYTNIEDYTMPEGLLVSLEQIAKIKLFAANRVYEVTYTNPQVSNKLPTVPHFVTNGFKRESLNNHIDIAKTTWDWKISYVDNFKVTKDGVVIDWLNTEPEPTYNMTDEFANKIIFACRNMKCPRYKNEQIAYFAGLSNNLSVIEATEFVLVGKQYSPISILYTNMEDYEIFEPTYTMTEEFASRIHKIFTKCEMLYKGKRICALRPQGTVMEMLINTVDVGDAIEVRYTNIEDYTMPAVGEVVTAEQITKIRLLAANKVYEVTYTNPQMGNTLASAPYFLTSGFKRASVHTHIDLAKTSWGWSGCYVDNFKVTKDGVNIDWLDWLNTLPEPTYNMTDEFANKVALACRNSEYPKYQGNIISHFIGLNGDLEVVRGKGVGFVFAGKHTLIHNTNIEDYELKALTRITPEQIEKIKLFAANKAYQVSYNIQGTVTIYSLGNGYRSNKTQFPSGTSFMDLAKDHWNWESCYTEQFKVVKDGVNIDWQTAKATNMTEALAKQIFDAHWDHKEVKYKGIGLTGFNKGKGEVMSQVTYYYGFESPRKEILISEANIEDFTIEEEKKATQKSFNMTEEFAQKLFKANVCTVKYQGKQVTAMLRNVGDSKQSLIQHMTITVADDKYHTIVNVKETRIEDYIWPRIVVTMAQVEKLKLFAAHKHYRVTYTNDDKVKVWQFTNGYPHPINSAYNKDLADAAIMNCFNWKECYLDNFEVKEGDVNIDWQTTHPVIYFKVGVQVLENQIKYIKAFEGKVLYKNQEVTSMSGLFFYSTDANTPIYWNSTKYEDFAFIPKINISDEQIRFLIDGLKNHHTQIRYKGQQIFCYASSIDGSFTMASGPVVGCFWWKNVNFSDFSIKDTTPTITTSDNANVCSSTKSAEEIGFAYENFLRTFAHRRKWDTGDIGSIIAKIREAKFYGDNNEQDVHFIATANGWLWAKIGTEKLEEEIANLIKALEVEVAN
jgi:hypothetical protein